MPKPTTNPTAVVDETTRLVKIDSGKIGSSTRSSHQTNAAVVTAAMAK